MTNKKIALGYKLPKEPEEESIHHKYYASKKKLVKLDEDMHRFSHIFKKEFKQIR